MVSGDITPTSNVKFFPAIGGVDWAQKAGLTGPGKKMFVPSSGNFLLSVDHIIKKKCVDLKIIGVVSSKLGVGKRKDLEARKIELITERDLATSLGLSEPGDTLDMLAEHSLKSGIPIMHQYNCDSQGQWNFRSYLPIAEEVICKIDGGISIFSATAGTKGKIRAFRTGNVVAAFPYPGESFPGGRDEDAIEHVGNSFGFEPIRRTTDQIVAYYWAAKLYEAGIPVGITAAAEFVTARHYSLEFLRSPHHPEKIIIDGKIRILIVASDSIGPYIQEGMKYFPHMYGQMVDPRS